MHAITLPTFGGPEVMVWAEVPDPRPGPGEVLLDIVASAVNRADILQRQGFYPPPPGAPPYPGLECAGRIRELGPGVTGWSVGDEVAALLGGGGYAEQVAVPATQLLPRPVAMSLVEAGGLAEVTCTVWSNVFLIAGLQPGATLLVHGGASGIGTTAIQLASAIGARVAITAGSPEKLERCRQLGADILINYREDDFVAKLKAATDGRGADVILDNMGAAYLSRNVDALAVNGRLVIIGMQGGLKAELNIGALMSKRGAVLATSLRARDTAEKATIVAAVRRHVLPLIEAGKLRIVVDRTLPIQRAADAHRAVENSEHVGKVLLTVGG
ncbi:MAG TPA: NAD(P)H-quinone oxidoreductase [Sporichthyaceae bacterium]|jgi:putative PIG3 family NAD(P)H quinone oxidoreductase|nr:NAD(P)H-quinone oxidoreductase [Sporichthyaceae bacterium]